MLAKSIKDIYNKLQTLKNRKVPGKHEMSKEFIKYGGESIEKELQILFQKKKWQQGKYLTSELKRSITTPIFKKGQKSDPENTEM